MNSPNLRQSDPVQPVTLMVGPVQVIIDTTAAPDLIDKSLARAVRLALLASEELRQERMRRKND